MLFDQHEDEVTPDVVALADMVTYSYQLLFVPYHLMLIASSTSNSGRSVTGGNTHFPQIWWKPFLF